MVFIRTKLIDMFIYIAKKDHDCSYNLVCKYTELFFKNCQLYASVLFGVHCDLTFHIFVLKERKREEEQRKAREVLLRRQKGADSSESDEDKK